MLNEVFAGDEEFGAWQNRLAGYVRSVMAYLRGLRAVP